MKKTIAKTGDISHIIRASKAPKHSAKNSFISELYHNLQNKAMSKKGHYKILTFN